MGRSGGAADDDAVDDAVDADAVDADDDADAKYRVGHEEWGAVSSASC